MIFKIAEEERALRHFVAHGGPSFNQMGGGHFLDEDVADGDRPCEAVADVVGIDGCKRIFAFRKHDDVFFNGFDAAAAAFLPEVFRNGLFNVRAEAVHIEITYPVFHVLPKIFAQFGAVEIQFGEVPSAVFDSSVFIAFHEIRMVFNEYGGWPAMVIDEIEHDQKAEAVGGGDKTPKIVVGTVFGIRVVIVL